MDRSAHELRLADALAREVADLYGVGILEEPDEDDPDDPRRDLSVAFHAYLEARAR